MNRIIPAFIAMLVLVACTHRRAATEIATRDTTINSGNSYSELFFDSLAVEKFITVNRLHDSVANAMRNFYNSRNYQYAWFLEEGLADYANTFLGMQNSYIGYSGDSSIYNPALGFLVDSLGRDSLARIPDSLRLQTELSLTRQFFRYTYRAYAGIGQSRFKDLNWYIPRKKINYVAFLDSMVTNQGKNLAGYEPVNKQYNLLKKFLLQYYALERSGNWDSIRGEKKSYRVGDSSQTISAIQKRLYLLGDLGKPDSSGLFTPATAEAVKKYQRRYGLKEDGVVGASLLKEMNRPAGERIRQLLINMERMRWVPASPANADYLLVNIPAFKLYVYENGKLAWNMNVVVGSTVHNTVIFNGDMKYVVFSPYWNVPRSIIQKEIMPGMKRDKDYLARHNMEWNNGNVRQKPGPGNSLGQVKFLFPNSYNIYLHDTPSKNLFAENKRAFSHGCIRLAEPEKLATFLLRNDTTWTAGKIKGAMISGKEKYVTLKKTVPVFIGYFTAWVDDRGELNFRDDIYGHDKQVADNLFAGKHLAFLN